MPSLKAIRKRIASVKNTKKITAAMKLVAGARLRRAQDAVTAARPYARRMQDVIAEIASRAGGEAHPLLARPGEEAFGKPGNQPGKKIDLVLLTFDRGLCGGFNSNISRRVERFLIDDRAHVGGQV